ncbi:MAG TPA: FAD-dependent oxidoreductase, partial [Pseudonocardia sp.]|nr:FAD-dependent oxidoreductase [Pseudonocardia sp.]
AAPAVLEPDAGVLLADRALAACVGWLRWRPEATLLAHRRAERVDPAGPAVHLADGEVVRADALVVAAGPWSRRLVGRRHTRDLILYRQSVLYCRVPDPDLERWAETPAVPALGTREGAWLVPPVAGTPLKVSAASACRAVGDVGDRRTEDRWVEHVGTICTGIIPGFDDGWITDARDCYYLASPRPRGRAVVALGERAVAVAACGGGAAKTAPVIADALVRRVTRPAGVSRTGAATRASRGTPLSRTSSP